jgi:hypothetical protein
VFVLVFAVAVGASAQWVYSTTPQRVSGFASPNAAPSAAGADPAEAERCKVPNFAKAMGHEEKWKLHNNCK